MNTRGRERRNAGKINRKTERILYRLDRVAGTEGYYQLSNLALEILTPPHTLGISSLNTIPKQISEEKRSGLCRSVSMQAFMLEGSTEYTLSQSGL